MGLELSHNGEAERACLGSLLVGGTKAMGMIAHLLEPSDFYFGSHQTVFAACIDLFQKGEAIDIVTVSNYIRSHKSLAPDFNNALEEIGGSSFIAELSGEIVTTWNIAEYARIVQHHASLRNVLRAAQNIARLSQDQSTDLGTLLDKAEKELQRATRSRRAQEDVLEIADLNDYMEIARTERSADGQIRGLSTGLFKVDKMTQGFLPGELMILSGQTSHGKTQLSNNITKKAVDAGKRVMFITMEMTKKEIADRFNHLTNDKDIGEGKVLLNMHADLKYTDVTKLIEKAKERGCDLVIIDHLHYFSRSVDNATAEVSKIVKEFKGAAVKYEIPIILLCHVRKMPPKKHPTLEDLRDSSLIAQDADMVLIVWRDESPNAADPFKVEVTLHKNRNRQKKHRREFLYADGMKLLEDEPAGPVADEKKQEYYEQNARLLGERDDDNEDDLSFETEVGEAAGLKDF